MEANELIQALAEQQFITKTIQMPAGHIDDFHSHPWHQIVFPVQGLLQSDIDDKCAIVPHNGMLYIPAHTIHRSVAITDTQFLAIYLNPNKYVQFNDEPKPCLVSPFLKELLLLFFNGKLDRELDKQPTLKACPVSVSTSKAESTITHLLMVLRDQIEAASRYEIPLLIPKDKRLLSIFTQLKQQPSLPLTLKMWATQVGASERTLSRLCAKEFARSFSLWRQNIRLVLSLQLLNSTKSIQTIAMELGYTSDATYISAFKTMFNQTPNQYRQQHLR
ncbi:helix-turn-helix transcriptional regulator [uncultured Shewanella sp.]|uniref:AraC family transcriptional regulator n=1 Tax=uncultured Shewanella sp. TaxID=173975 RepID=UPI0026258354|nr:helix-turn-helix transcriptional regulator [uncultured Shewanella sp.]